MIAACADFHGCHLEGLREELGLADAVEFTGWIPRDELYDLYARAWAFVYPSTFEGFGLPVLEALAAGVPTACSHIEPLAGIAGDAALAVRSGRRKSSAGCHDETGLGRRTAHTASGRRTPTRRPVFMANDGALDAGCGDGGGSRRLIAVQPGLLPALLR